MKINRSYAQGPLICKEYESNFNIKNSWPVVGIGNQDVDTRFGIVCQMPDGRWVEKGTMYKLKLIEENEKKGILKSTTLDRFERDGQWCFIKIVIRQKGDDIIKEEIMECADTEHGRTDKEKIAELEKQIELEKAKKPGYWELFAAFYYKDLNAPEYCRLYSQPSHAYKAIGTACLTTDGKWERR